MTLPSGETVNRPVTISFGRTDGSSGSLMADPGAWLEPLEMYDWLRDELSGKYTAIDGTMYRQQLYGFHFNHDVGMLTYNLWDGLQLVHKATAKVRGLLCATEHTTDDEECLKYHRFDPDDCRRILRDGGEEDYIAWDSSTRYGFSASAGRRFYMEWRPQGDRMEGNRRVDVHDVGNLFPGNFEQVIDLWKPELREGDREIIAWGKKIRKDGFWEIDRQRIADYSEAECVSLARLIAKFLITLRETVGVVMDPSKVYGSGSVAAEVLKYHSVTKRKQLETGETRPVLGIRIADIAQMTYFGGKIEGPVIGVLTEDANPRDLNSAYPSQCVWLPCQAEGHGAWFDRRGHHDLPDQAVGYVLASWDWTKINTQIPPFMVRNKLASVFAPQIGSRVWVTLPEYQAAVQRWGAGSVIAHHTVWWENVCECLPPLAFLQEVYDRRRGEKARAVDPTLTEDERLEAKGREEILKLIINSLYGKLAQRKPQFGAYTNLHWAAMITGATRAKLNEEGWSGEALGGTVVYMHTDSVTFVGIERDDEGKALGAWGKEDPKESLFIVQPGIAISLGAGKSATRGVRKDSIIPFARSFANEKMEMFRRHPSTWETMLPNETRMVTLRQAHHLNKPWLAGSFQTKPQKVGFRSGKRDFDGAKPLNAANVYAWKLPPKYLILPEEMARLEDLESYQIMIREEIRAGLWDAQDI